MIGFTVTYTKNNKKKVHEDSFSATCILDCISLVYEEHGFVNIINIQREGWELKNGKYKEIKKRKE